MRFKISRAFNSSGFTLIEVLVVLIIISIITAVAVLALGSFDRGRREKMIVEQFTQVIAAAQQQAILTPMVLGLTITHNGYQFYQYGTIDKKTPQWQPLRNDVLSRSYAFHRVFTVDVKSIAAYSSVSKKSLPAIVFLPSGYVTPFVLNLKGDKKSFDVTVKNNGEVVSHA
jgi:general secretion pathway protein H